MFVFSQKNRWYPRIGVTLIAIQFWLFIAALPPFETGIWMQTEPVMVAMFTCACANAVWLLWGICTDRLLMRPMPAVAVCLMLWLGWQLLVTALSANPWHSWFGPAEIGEGTGWHTMIMLQVMVLYPLWNDVKLRRVLMGAVIASLIPQCALHAFYPQQVELAEGVESWAPGAWGAYLAFMAAPVWIGCVTGGFLKKRRNFVALLSGFLIVLIISHNKSAECLFPLALVISAIIIFLSKNYSNIKRFFTPNKHWRLAVMFIACAMPVAWTEFSAICPAFSANHYDNSIAKYLSEKDGAMSTRLAFNKIGMIAIEHEPMRWIMGNGWGHFRDDLFKYVLIDGVTVYQGQERKPDWFMVDGYAFHSHNQPLEALLSLGLVGMVLWFAVPIAAIMQLPKRFFWSCAPLLVAETMLCGVWFALPQCMPYLALFWVVLSPRDEANVHRVKPRITVMLGIAALAMVWSAWQQWDAMWYGEKLHDANYDAELRNYNIGWIQSDIFRGGERLRSLATGYSDYMSEQETVNENDMRWFAQYLAALHRASISPIVGVQVASAEAQMQYDILDSPALPSIMKINPGITMRLPDALVRLAAMAPQRDDIATRYLATLAEDFAPNIPREIKISRELLAVSPDHRGALWKLGCILRTLPGHKAEGMEMQKKAIRLGLSAIYPLGKQDTKGIE